MELNGRGQVSTCGEGKARLSLRKLDVRAENMRAALGPLSQLPASMWKVPPVAPSLAFVEGTMLPMLMQRSPRIPRKRPRKPRRMAVIMSARQPWI